MILHEVTNCINCFQIVNLPEFCVHTSLRRCSLSLFGIVKDEYIIADAEGKNTESLHNGVYSLDMRATPGH
jgi:hypothetical protein